MFLGHLACGFAAKRFAPEVSLGTLLAASQLADLVWPTLVLAGVEQVAIAPGITAVTPLDFIHYPYSHSLLALLGWAALFAGGWWLLRRGSTRTGLVLAALVVSHWVLDVASHRPDMPLGLFGETRLGFGMWDSKPLTLAVELGLLAVGAAVYLGATRAKDRIGRVGLISLLVFLALVFLSNAYGPPPPSPTAVALVAQSLWLLVAWGAWVDRHRRPASPR